MNRPLRAAKKKILQAMVKHGADGFTAVHMPTCVRDWGIDFSTLRNAFVLLEKERYLELRKVEQSRSGGIWLHYSVDDDSFFTVGNFEAKLLPNGQELYEQLVTEDEQELRRVFPRSEPQPVQVSINNTGTLQYAGGSVGSQSLVSNHMELVSVLHHEIERSDLPPHEKKDMLKKIGSLAAHPAFLAILGKALEAIK